MSRYDEIYNQLKDEGMNDSKAAFIANRMMQREQGTLPTTTLVVEREFKLDSEIESICRKLGRGIWTLAEFPAFYALTPFCEYQNSSNTVFATRKRVDHLDQVTVWIK